MSFHHEDSPVCGLTRAAAQWNKHLSICPYRKLFDSGLKICQIGFALRSVGHIPQAAAASGMNLPDKVLNYFKLQSIDFKSKAIFYVTALAVAAA